MKLIHRGDERPASGAGTSVALGLLNSTSGPLGEQPAGVELAGIIPPLKRVVFLF
jgi:hypothetical protein